MPPQIVRDTAPGHAADLGADQLDRDEQRITHHHRPGEPQPELRADLAVRADAAGIVVRRAGHQPGADGLADVAVFFGLWFERVRRHLKYSAR